MRFLTRFIEVMLVRSVFPNIVHPVCYKFQDSHEPFYFN